MGKVRCGKVRCGKVRYGFRLRNYIRRTKKMKKYEIQIEGSADMLINKFDHELNKEKSKVQKDKMPEWEEKNWRRKAYFDKNDNVILPDTYIIGSLRKGAFASGLQLSKKTGKKTISKAFIDSNLLIEESPLIGNVKDLTPFSTNVKIGTATIMTIRPMLKKGWCATFFIYDLNGMFTEDEIIRLFDYCGKFVGLGDWRPKYGRYKVKSVEGVKDV